MADRSGNPLHSGRGAVKTLLLIDFHNTLNRSIAVNTELSHNDLPTGGIYGVFNQLIARLKEYEPSYIAAVTDTKPYHRSLIYPEYKANRKQNDDEFYQAYQHNRDELYKLFSLMEIPVIGVKGFEADDLIAYIVELFHNKFDRIICLSNDNDLFQLFKFENFFLHKNKMQYGINQYKKGYPYLDLKHWVLASAMSGTHNNLPGVPRVGLKTAAKIIGNDVKYRKVMQQYEDLINLNMTLIKLPFDYETYVKNSDTVLYPKTSLLVNIRDSIIPFGIGNKIKQIRYFLMDNGIQFTQSMADTLDNYKN